MLKTQLKYLGIILMFISSFAVGQGRFDVLKSKLELAAKTQQGLNESVNISVNHYTLQEVIRAIAQENNLNVSVDPTIRATPSYNFSNAKVKDVFLLLCKEHDLTLQWTGAIITFKPYIPEEEPPLPKSKKIINLSYNAIDSTITGVLTKDTLLSVIQKISQLTKMNVDVTKGMETELISMTIVNQKFEDVLSRLAGEKDWDKVSDNFYQIKEKPKAVEQPNSKRRSPLNNRNNRSARSSRSSSTSEGDFTVDISNELISIEALETDLKEIISDVCNKTNKNYFLFDEPKGTITLKTHDLTFEETLTYLLNTSDFTYRRIDSIYIIGDRKKEKFRHTESFQFQYRTIEGIADIIPADLKQNIDIKESVELNSFILSGSLPEINELKRFLFLIDKVVPMILIEVMIVDINRSKTISTGIAIAGGGNNQQTTGSFGGGADNTGQINATLNSNTLNAIVNAINNLGFFNLGTVGEGFYLNMRALEENGKVKIVSTPKLAALNGHEAEMSIGETTYYQEPQTNVIGTQNPQTVQTITYKPINADLSLTIKPVVSGDDQITLEITVSQSDFTNRTGTAPPDYQKREFKSVIRMKNQEMVVLGGLDNSRKSNNNSGVPLLNRIPIIKWFFGNQSKENSKSELTIFIRPTVIL